MRVNLKFFSFRILAIAFFAGGAVMAFEISASRLLAPFFGTSLVVWTNIIGVVLAALALGYWLGGKWADQKQGSTMSVGLLLGGAGLWALCIPGLVKYLSVAVTDNFRSGDISGAVPVFFISCLTFVLPVGLLGAINPVLVKQLADNNHHVGKSSGSVGAWSTIGSIVGTFVAGLYLVPTIGTRYTMLATAWLLIVLAGASLWPRKILIASGVIGAVIFSGYYLGLGAVKASDGLILEADSPYHFIQILEDAGGNRRMVFNSGLGVQTVYQPGGGELGVGYYDQLAKLPEVLAGTEKVRVLMVGLAGGEILHQLHTRYGGRVELTAVEIDPAVVDLAKKYFDLDQLPLRIIIEDARTFLSHNSGSSTTDTDKYDIIVVDAYQNEMYLPWQLTTKEFWQLVQHSLSVNGIAAANILAGLPSSPLLSAVANTSASIFDRVVVGQSGVANYSMIMGNAQGLLEKVLAVDAFRGFNLVLFDENKPVLTDDRAPVEQLAHQALREFWGSH